LIGVVPVVWVTSEEEWQASPDEGRKPEAVPWTAAVRLTTRPVIWLEIAVFGREQKPRNIPYRTEGLAGAFQ